MLFETPPGFQYGQGTKNIVILVPRTGHAKSLNITDYADVLWLNIPEFLLGHIPTDAEYVAYAINYVSGIYNNKNFSIISRSQEGFITQ